jgi:hypothetical protein
MNESATSKVRAFTSSDRSARVEEIFTPSSPVARRDLFAGRTQLIQQLLELSQQPGRHAVVFGEPGAGKSSLATVLPEFAAGPIGLVRVSACPSDTFATLWRHAGEGVRAQLRRAERGLAPPAFGPGTSTSLDLAGAVTEDAVLALLAQLSATTPSWIVFDDFHSVADAETRVRMRALAESTATIAPRATLVFAGTAHSGDRLIGSSASLVPVHVTRLSVEESIEAVLRALRQVGLAAEDAVIERIATLANGLPQVIQALARATARAAEGEARLSHAHLDAAVRAVIDDTSAAVRVAYEHATVRARRGIYPEILLACALAPRDSFGTFSVVDVCDGVTRIVRREVRGLTNQVSALTEDGRGSVLEKQGAAKAARYRFVNPGLEPYILMRGLAEGWTTHQAPSWLPGSSEAGQLQKAA